MFQKLVPGDYNLLGKKVTFLEIHPLGEYFNFKTYFVFVALSYIHMILCDGNHYHHFSCFQKRKLRHRSELPKMSQLTFKPRQSVSKVQAPNLCMILPWMGWCCLHSVPHHAVVTQLCNMNILSSQFIWIDPAWILGAAFILFPSAPMPSVCSDMLILPFPSLWFKSSSLGFMPSVWRVSLSFHAC